jgi:hypothetical protein
MRPTPPTSYDSFPFAIGTVSSLTIYGNGQNSGELVMDLAQTSDSVQGQPSAFRMACPQRRKPCSMQP